MTTREPSDSPPTNALEALARARFHTRRAGIELVAAAHAVLDAASLAWSGEPSEANSTLRSLATVLDELADRLGRGQGELPEPIAHIVLTALDQEIERWEKRSQTDSDARAVLRAFLSVREVLWELGVRPESGQQPRASSAARKSNDPGEARDHADGGVEGLASDATAGPSPNANRQRATRVRRLSRVDVKLGSK